MKTPFLIGDRIYLRPLCRDDLNECYLSWLNDPEVNRFLTSGRFPYTMDELESYYERLVGSRSEIILAIIDKSTDKHIGNIKLGPIDWISREAALGLLIGEKSFWGQGYGTEAVRLILDYAFKRLNLHKVCLGVHANHPEAIGAYKRAGFREEGRLREAAFIWGEYVDGLRMGVLREEYLELEQQKEDDVSS